MSHFRIFAILLLTLFTKLSFSQTVVCGSIHGKVRDTVAISRYLNNLDFEYREYSALPDKKGNFKIEIPLDKPSEMYFEVGEDGVEIFLHPGDSIYLSADQGNFTHTLTFSGRGSAECNYYALRSRELGSFDARSYANMTHQSLDSPQRYLQFCDSLEIKAVQFLNKQQSHLSADFIQHERDYIKYHFLSDRMRYPLIHGYTNNMKINSFGDSLYRAGYYSFLNGFRPPKDSIPDNTDASLFFEDYVDFLYHPMWYNKNEGIGHYSSWEKYQIAKISFDGTVEDFATAVILLHVFDYDRLSLCDSLYSDFRLSCADSTIRNLVERNYSKLKRLAPGGFAPAITLKDIDGNIFTLEQCRGKLVYMDFWSVGCVPCLKEFPHADSLKNEFEGRDIVFVYVNCDNNQAAWKKMVKEKHLKGVHLNISGTQNAVGEAYNISGFPTYILIGKDGRIIDNHPPRPSDPKLRQLLLKSL